MSNFFGSTTNQQTIIGHPVGLFVLFFTEMWERFSYYGMRAILVLFLIDEVSNGGFGWERSDALVLFAFYTGLVYLTPIIGGYLADTYLGSRNSVVIGALIMTFGHASLAFETVFMFYTGIGLLIIGNGFFKPNITPIVGQMYPEGSPLKDSAYTIFYMAVNAGAFLGFLICGWLGETVSWSYGFGAAGIFMFFGALQFYFGQKIFGNIGERKPKEQKQNNFGETEVPFENDDKIWFGVSIVAGIVTGVLLWVIEVGNPLQKLFIIAPFIAIFTAFIVRRLRKYPVIERDRLSVVAMLAFFTIFFWLAFEQAGGTITIFAEDYTQRSLSTPVAATAFRYVSLVLTFIPMIILTWMVWKLGVKIFRDFPLTIIFTSLSFLIIWGVVIYINKENFASETLEVPASWFGSLNAFFIISLGPLFSNLWLRLNQKKMNPPGPLKFALGFLLLGIGFVFMVVGSLAIPAGAKVASVTMLWLILFYFFQTVGELCVSPVGLSLVNKLSPKRLMALMFGVWYIANFVANFTGGIIGSYIDRISETSSLSGFFSIFVVITFIAGGLLVVLNNRFKKLMHGVE